MDSRTVGKHAAWLALALVLLLGAGACARRQDDAGTAFPETAEATPLPSAKKDGLAGDMSHLEVWQALGPPHGTWGFGFVRNWWFFDDGTCLFFFGNRAKWLPVSGEDRSFGAMDRLNAEQAVCVRCGQGMTPLWPETPDGPEPLCAWLRENAVSPGMPCAEIATRFGEPEDLPIADFRSSFRLWTFPEGMCFAGVCDETDKLEEGFWFPQDCIEEPMAWFEFLDTGIWLPVAFLSEADWSGFNKTTAIKKAKCAASAKYRTWETIETRFAGIETL